MQKLAHACSAILFRVHLHKKRKIIQEFIRVFIDAILDFFSRMVFDISFKKLGRLEKVIAIQFLNL